MKGHILKRFLAIVLITIICLQHAVVLAQEVTPTPEAQAQEATTEATLNTSQAQDSSNSAQLSITTPGADQITNSGDNVTVNSSQDTTNSLQINNNNDLNLVKNSDSQQITGENTADKNITLVGETTIKTGEATDNQNLSTIVNTNIVGSAGDFVLQNIFEPQSQDIDLSNVHVCENQNVINTPESLKLENTGNSVTVLDATSKTDTVAIQNNNDATIKNDVTVLAKTGGNEAVGNIGSVTVQTGDASANLNLFTMANTNIVGNCFFFGVFNLFSPVHGDIIMPYELDLFKDPNSFIQNRNNIINTGDDVTATNSSTLSTFLGVQNNNNAAVTTTIKTNTDTGNNTIQDAITFGDGPSITTGKASSVVNLIDLINSNIFGNGFMMLKINKMANWFGKIIGFGGQIFETPDSIILFSQPVGANVVNTGDNAAINQSQQTINDFRVVNTNNATVENNVDLSAITGENQAGRFNPKITTGNASVNANIFDLVNTNIVGNNWFVGVINIFDDFFGNIVFARPDLTIVKSADKTQANPGEIVQYVLYYGNTGQLNAENVVITDNLPANEDFISAFPNPQTNQNNLSWNLGTIAKGQSGKILLTVRIRGDAPIDNQVVNTASIKTTVNEPEQSNNTNSVSVIVRRPVSSPSSSSSSSSSSSPSSQSSSSSSSSSSNNSNNNPVASVLGAIFKKKPVKIVKKTLKKIVKKIVKKPVKKIVKKRFIPIKKIFLKKIKLPFKIFRVFNQGINRFISEKMRILSQLFASTHLRNTRTT